MHVVVNPTTMRSRRPLKFIEIIKLQFELHTH
jgi:hypothetical protein